MLRHVSTLPFNEHQRGDDDHQGNRDSPPRAQPLRESEKCEISDLINPVLSTMVEALSQTAR
jgi:hypothetical protein